MLKDLRIRIFPVPIVFASAAAAVFLMAAASSFAQAPKDVTIVGPVDVRSLVSCSSPAGIVVNSASVVTTERPSPTAVVYRSFEVPLNDRGVSQGRAYFIGALSTRLYSDQPNTGAGVRASVLRSDGTGAAWCVFSIAGHVVPLSPSDAIAAPIEANTTKGPQEVVLPYTGVLPPEAFSPPPGTVVKLEAP